MDLVKAPDAKNRKKPVVTITFQDPDKEFNNARKQRSSSKGVASSSDNVVGPPQLKRPISAAPSLPGTTDLDSDLDLKKTRYEIMKFAVNSLKNEERVDAEERLVIQLGGKKEKKKAVNYKILIEQRKKEKQLDEERKRSQVKPRISVNKSKNKSKARNNSSNVRRGTKIRNK